MYTTTDTLPCTRAVSKIRHPYIKYIMPSVFALFTSLFPPIILHLLKSPFFFFNNPPPTEFYPLPLPDPLPIYLGGAACGAAGLDRPRGAVAVLEETHQAA